MIDTPPLPHTGSRERTGKKQSTDLHESFEQMCRFSPQKKRTRLMIKVRMKM